MIGNSYNLIILQNNKFFKIGQLMGMSIAQQGSGFPFFSQTAYKYLCNEDVSSLEVIIADVPFPDVRDFLEKVVIYLHMYAVTL